MAASSLPYSNRRQQGTQTSQVTAWAPATQRVHQEARKQLGQAKELQFVRHPDLEGLQQ